MATDSLDFDPIPMVEMDLIFNPISWSNLKFAIVTIVNLGFWPMAMVTVEHLIIGPQ